MEEEIAASSQNPGEQANDNGETTPWQCSNSQEVLILTEYKDFLKAGHMKWKDFKKSVASHYPYLQGVSHNQMRAKVTDLLNKKRRGEMEDDKYLKREMNKQVSELCHRILELLEETEAQAQGSSNKKKKMADEVIVRTSQVEGSGDTVNNQSSPPHHDQAKRKAVPLDPDTDFMEKASSMKRQLIATGELLKEKLQQVPLPVEEGLKVTTMAEPFNIAWLDDPKFTSKVALRRLNEEKTGYFREEYAHNRVDELRCLSGYLSLKRKECEAKANELQQPARVGTMPSYYYDTANGNGLGLGD